MVEQFDSNLPKSSRWMEGEIWIVISRLFLVFADSNQVAVNIFEIFVWFVNAQQSGLLKSFPILQFPSYSYKKNSSKNWYEIPLRRLGFRMDQKFLGIKFYLVKWFCLLTNFWLKPVNHLIAFYPYHPELLLVRATIKVYCGSLFNHG